MDHHPRRSPAPRLVRHSLSKAPPVCVCSGSSTSATIASVNAPSNYLYHLSYDNAAYAGLDISTACHPPSLLEESMTSTKTSIAGRDLEAAPKLDGLIQSSTISILLASTSPMLPRWSLTNPSGRPLLADCLRSNPSKARKSSRPNFHSLANCFWEDNVVSFVFAKRFDELGIWKMFSNELFQMLAVVCRLINLYVISLQN